jgi:tetratricopeptide (TPR) repeat protein
MVEEKMKKAEAFLIAAIQLKPDYLPALMLEAAILSDRKQVVDLTKILDLAKTVAPNDQTVAFQAGQLYAQAGALQPAEAEISRGLNIGPDNEQMRGLLNEIKLAKLKVKPVKASSTPKIKPSAQK